MSEIISYVFSGIAFLAFVYVAYSYVMTGKSVKEIVAEVKEVVKKDSE